MIVSLFGYNVAVSQSLVGSKKAVKKGRTVYVSPAMHDLLNHAGRDEFKRLLRAIPLLDLGGDDSPSLDIMTVPLPHD